MANRFSLSLKLAGRKRFKYTTLSAALILACMLGSLFIIKNPKGSEAATQVGTLTITAPNYPMPIYDTQNQKMYLVDGYDNWAWSVVQSVNLASPSPMSSEQLVSGPVGIACMARADSVSIFNPNTKRGYLIGGSLRWSDEYPQITPSITEVDLANPTNASLIASKCTWFGGDGRYGSRSFRPSSLGAPYSSYQLTIHSSNEDSYGDTSFTARTGMSVAYDSTSQKAYIFGGLHPVWKRDIYGSWQLVNEYVNEVFELDTSITIAHPNLSIRKLSSAANLNLLGDKAYTKAVYDPVSRKIYIFGGQTCVDDGQGGCNEQNLSDILEFDPNAGTDGTFTEINHDGLYFTPRVAKSVVTDNGGTVYIVGSDSSYGGTNTDDVIKFDTQTKTIIKTNKIGPALLSGYASMFYNNAIYTFGGGTAIYKIDLASSATTSSASGVIIKKTLTAVNRLKADGTYPSSNATFNPYAVQKGDIIKVELNITGAAGTYSVTDTPLKIPNGPGGPGAGNSNIKCDQNGSHLTALQKALLTTDSGFIDGATGNVVWPSLSGTKTESYFCEIVSS